MGWHSELAGQLRPCLRLMRAGGRVNLILGIGAASTAFSEMKICLAALSNCGFVLETIGGSFRATCYGELHKRVSKTKSGEQTCVRFHLEWNYPVVSQSFLKASSLRYNQR